MGFSKFYDHSTSHPSSLLKNFRALLEPVSDEGLRRLAVKSSGLTRRYFGKTMHMFAPLYLSNECINSCSYCGFSRENAILRVTLELQEVTKEALHLIEAGFRDVLLVAGEHPKFVSQQYLARCVRQLADKFPSVCLEVAPMEVPDYHELVAAGAEGIALYQETYHRPTYSQVHQFGPKKNFDWRLDGPERAYAAGFRRLGVAALYGLWEWQEEAFALAAHIEYLLRTCWQAQLSVSLPRLRPAAGNFSPPYPISDREFIQLVCALRITFPQIGIVLSTRECAQLRDILAPLGITHMSAGSHTEPGGYTGQGTAHLHCTVRGKSLPVDENEVSATEQFLISDKRSPAQVSQRLSELGLDTVWKDWDAGIFATT